MGVYVDTTNEQWRFSRVLLILIEPFNRGSRKRTSTGIQTNSTCSARSMKAIPTPAWPQALETVPPGMRRIRLEKKVASELRRATMKLGSFK